jgi:hypothetical protein
MKKPKPSPKPEKSPNQEEAAEPGQGRALDVVGVDAVQIAPNSIEELQVRDRQPGTM